MYLFEVKKPDESKGDVGLLQASSRTIPAEEAFQPRSADERLPAGQE